MSCGHDAAVTAIHGGQAALCLLAADASDRLKREFRHLTAPRGIAVLELRETMTQIWQAIGIRAGVMTIDDEGFAKKLAALQDHEEESR